MTAPNSWANFSGNAAEAGKPLASAPVCRHIAFDLAVQCSQLMRISVICYSERRTASG
jgi:hypothetical protein